MSLVSLSAQRLPIKAIYSHNHEFYVLSFCKNSIMAKYTDNKIGMIDVSFNDTESNDNISSYDNSYGNKSTLGSCNSTGLGLVLRR